VIDREPSVSQKPRVCGPYDEEVSRGDASRKRLSTAIAAALDDLEQLSGAEERYRAVSWLVDHLGDAISAAGKLPAQAVVALRHQENRSLAQLGERLGLSKARAADVVRDIPRMASIDTPGSSGLSQ